MTRDELIAKYPHASESFLRRNLEAGDSGPTPKLECSAGDGPLAAAQAEKPDTAKFLVRVTSRRKRLIDEDNLAEKFHVDCCRYAGLIPSDAPATTHIEVRQEKAGAGEAEEITIEVMQLPADSFGPYGSEGDAKWHP